DRRDQRATLTTHGPLLLTGGETLDGRSTVAPPGVDPTHGRGTPAPAEQGGPVEATVAGALPSPHAAANDPGAPVALRFSARVAADSVTTDQVTLSGPDGLVNTALVVAEEGRLLFLWPDTALADGATYTVSEAGLTDPSGRPVAAASLHFTTKPRP